MHAQSVSRQFHCKDKAAETRNLSKWQESYSRPLRRARSENRWTRMADEGTEPIKLSEASVERVAGRLAKLVAHNCYPRTRRAQLATQPKRKEAASKVRNMSTKFFY